MAIIMRFNEMRKNEKVKRKMDPEGLRQPVSATKPLDIP